MLVDGSDGSLMVGTFVALGMSVGLLAGMVSCRAGFETAGCKFGFFVALDGMSVGLRDGVVGMSVGELNGMVAGCVFVDGSGDEGTL